VNNITYNIPQWCCSRRGLHIDPRYESIEDLKKSRLFDIRIDKDMIALRDFNYSLEMGVDEEGWEYTPSLHAPTIEWNSKIKRDSNNNMHTINDHHAELSEHSVETLNSAVDNASDAPSSVFSGQTNDKSVIDVHHKRFNSDCEEPIEYVRRRLWIRLMVKGKDYEKAETSFDKYIHDNRRGVIKSGYMWKLGLIVKGWRKRFFILTDTELAYYTSSHPNERKLGSFSLEEGLVQLAESPSHKRANLISFTLADGTVRYLATDSELDRYKWVTVMLQQRSFLGQSNVNSSSSSRQSSFPLIRQGHLMEGELFLRRCDDCDNQSLEEEWICHRFVLREKIIQICSCIEGNEVSPLFSFDCLV
jgi:hypothetical protein